MYTLCLIITIDCFHLLAFGNNAAMNLGYKIGLFLKVPPRIQTTATHYVTNEGVPVSLPCVAAGSPTPTITWTKVGRASYHEGNRRGRLSASWEGNDDASRHGAWALLMSFVTLPQETNALTSRGPHYNMSKDGTLFITKPSAQDAGAYVCTATNAVGFSSQEMRLSVNSEWHWPCPGRGAWQEWRQRHGPSDLTCISQS